VNFWFYFADERFPAMIGIAAVIGMLSRDRIRERLVVLVYFLCFWAIFVFFYAGSYNYGADIRYSLMSYIPLPVLAGVGLERIALAVATAVLHGHSTRGVFAMTSAVLAIQFSW
jgi:predicted membrane-bound mannosyltransferase